MSGTGDITDPVDWDHEDRGDDLTEPVEDVHEGDDLDRADDVTDVDRDETGLDADIQDGAAFSAADADDDADGGTAAPGAAGSVEPTGHPRVDEAVARLDELDELPTSEHADVYEDVHRRLHSALTDLDSD